MISGKSFADRCAWVFDPRYPDRPRFSYTNAANGDWVFVNGDYLTQFRGLCPMFSRKQFVVIVHNTDRPFGLAQLGMLLPISRHIYAINTTVSHPGLTTIPLGFVDRQLPFLSTFQRPDVPRDIDVYANFTQTTNDDKRRACAMAFKDDPRVTWRSGLSVPEYYADLCRSKFVLCPEGTGIDTHRVYEALLCGATPVVLRNSLASLYARLPVCIVNRWTDPFTVPSQGVKDWSVPFFLTRIPNEIHPSIPKTVTP
jgi:hypothetical protein